MAEFFFMYITSITLAVFYLVFALGNYCGAEGTLVKISNWVVLNPLLVFAPICFVAGWMLETPAMGTRFVTMLIMFLLFSVMGARWVGKKIEG